MAGRNGGATGRIMAIGLGNRTQNGSAPLAGRTYSRSAENETWRLLILLAIIGLTWLIFHELTDGIFVTPRNLTNLTVQMAITGLVAVGVTWLIIAREIDLSIGSMFGLVTVVTIDLQATFDWGPAAAVATGLAIGAGVGALQGLITIKLLVPSFIVTLAAFSYLRGIAYVVTGAQTPSGSNGWFASIANGRIPSTATLAIGVAAGVAGIAVWARSRWTQADRSTRRPARTLRPVEVLSAASVVGVCGILIWAYTSYRGLPYPVVVLAVVTLVGVFVARHTAFGRHIYAIGGNPEAARRAGIRVGAIIVTLFAISGTLAAVGGITLASLLDAGPANAGLLLALDAISATIIGGTSLFGGRGSIVGSLLGAALLASLQNGLNLMGVNTFYQYIAIGVILLGAVSIDALATRRTKIT